MKVKDAEVPSPKPWHTEDDPIWIGGQCYTPIVDAGSDPCIVAFVPFNTIDGGKTNHQKPNAQLLAAAPDLLEACVNALYLATIYRKKEGDGLMVNAFQDIYMRTSAAIAKATGKEVA